MFVGRKNGGTSSIKTQLQLVWSPAIASETFGHHIGEGDGMKDAVTTFGRSHTHRGEPKRRSYYGGRRRRSETQDGELLSATPSH